MNERIIRVVFLGGRITIGIFFVFFGINGISSVQAGIGQAAMTSAATFGSTSMLSNAMLAAGIVSMITAFYSILGDILHSHKKVGN